MFCGEVALAETAKAVYYSALATWLHSSMVEHRTFNPLVLGSSPSGVKTQ